MHKILPIYYAEYGRYTIKFRAMPYEIDALKLGERRLLLSLYEVAKDKFQKSAKVVGYAIGKYHPHGDISTYKMLINMVHTGWAEGRGNWGSPGLIDAEAAAMRYTEVRLAEWVKDLAFQYIDYVPRVEGELEEEVKYIPCPVPLGLVGHGFITGISFYRTLIPRFKLKDICKRLVDMLEDKYDEIIYPTITGCIIQEDADEMKKILTDGDGKLVVIPQGEIKDGSIYVTGKVPNSSSLIKLQESADNLKLNVKDLSKSSLMIKITPRGRGVDLVQLSKDIWLKYLTKECHFDCLFHNDVGAVVRCGIDKVIQNSYIAWREAVLDSYIDLLDKLNRKSIEIVGIKIIRQILQNNPTVKTVDAIVSLFEESVANKTVEVGVSSYDKNTNSFIEIKYEINSKLIRDICSSKSIKQLIEIDVDTVDIKSQIDNAKSKIQNLDYICYNYVKQLVH